MEVKLLKHQQEFGEAQDKEVLMLAPVGSGKTVAQIIDARDYAFKNPESMQLYLCHDAEIFSHCHYYGLYFEQGKFNSYRNEFTFDNGSIFRPISIEKGKDSYFYRYICGLVSNVIRIDVDFFDLSPRFYTECIIQANRPSQLQPKHIKITARDCLHSFTKRKGLKIIDVGYDDLDVHEFLHSRFPEYKKFIEGEWEE
jgi:hypothetical protein